MNRKAGIRQVRYAVVVAALLCLSGGGAMPLVSAARAQAGTASPSPGDGTLAVKRAEWQAANAHIRAAIDAGQTELLIGLAEKALALAEQAFGSDARETLANVRYLADVHYEQGQYAAAAPLYVRAIDGAGTEDDVIIINALDRLNSVNNLAVIYKSQGRYAEAEPLFERAVRVSERWMGSDHPDTLKLIKALVADRLSDSGLAPKALEPARALVTAIRARRDAMASPGLVNVQTTRELGNRSLDVFQKFGLANVRATRERGNDLDAFVLFADSGWARVGSAEDRAAITGETFTALQDAIAGTAGKAVERMAVRLAAERKLPGLGAIVRERQNLDDQSIINADESARIIAEPGEVAFYRRVELEAEGQRIQIGMDRLDARLRAEFPDYFTFASKNVLDVSAVQRLLEPDEAILLAVPAPFGTHVMAISRSDMKWQCSEWDRSKIAAAVRRLLWDVGGDVGIDAATSARWEVEGGPGYPFDRKTAHALYRQLITPVASVLAGKRHVFIAASGVLTSLPFGILVTEPPVGMDGDPEALRATKWFADAHALATIPTIQSLQFLREAAVGAGRSNVSAAFAGYGDPALSGKSQDRGARSGKAVAARAIFRAELSRSGSGIADVAEIRSLARLPGTATELENIRVALGAPRSSVHVQDQATEGVIRSADLSHVRILALATHGLMAGELRGAAEPGLVFTPPAQASDEDDGFLTASEVSTMQLDADWVILSACNTAAGDGSEGAPGLTGLARAFFYAGARNLLVSHWPVRDDVASSLTVDTIKRQQADPKLSRAEALQQAMRAIRNDATHDTAIDTWAHPNAWAPFSLIGDAAN
jgi:CHAT domain-containing protein/tetratricopeptide (TPR) repeat protein